MSRVTRGLVRAGAVIAVALLLVGCIRIPGAGDVATVAIAVDDDRDQLLPVPEGPVAGATPREIVIGFLRAGRGPQNGYAVASQYLTSDFASAWRPATGVVVSSTSINPVDREDGSLVVSLEVEGELDSGGRYADGAPRSTRDLAFELALEQGEWRISAAPDGTVLTPSFFDRLFEPVELYFYSPDFRFLVPERRWFLDTRSIANRIVDELLRADSTLLEANVLLTAFPSGTSRLESVQIDAGRASVTLSSELLAENRAAQWRILQQLAASVSSLSDVHSVSIVSGGLPVDISESGGTPERALEVDPIPIGMRDGVFGSLGVDEVRAIDGIGTRVDGIDALEASIARSRSAVAVLTAEGVVRVGPQGVTLVDAGTDRIAPSIDPWGYVWSAPRDHLEDLVAISPGGIPVSVGLGITGRVVAVEVARDGTRVLLALATGDGPRVVVAGIIRGADDAPVGLVESTLVATGPGDLLDATWVDGTTIALLTRSGTSTAVTLASLGGRVSSLGTVPGGVQIVGGNRTEGIRVRDADGAVYRPSGDSNWLDTGLRASFLATQQ